MLMHRIGGCVCLALLVMAGCSSSKHPALTVGSKNTTEQLVLAEIAAQHLEKRLGERVERRLNMNGTLLAHQAQLAGEVDIRPEYTGIAYSTILRLPPSSEIQIVRERVRDDFAKQFQIVWMSRLGFDNAVAMVIRGEDAGQEHLSTLTGAARSKLSWKVGATPEFLDRTDAYAALMRAYRVHLAAAPKSMDHSQLYKALESKEVNMVAGSTTDGMLTAMDIKILADDKHAFSPHEAAFLVREATITLHPKVRGALEELSGKLTTALMQKLNHEVDANHRQPADVAAEFLRQSGL